jgi:hypothetical protein
MTRIEYHVLTSSVFSRQILVLEAVPKPEHRRQLGDPSVSPIARASSPQSESLPAADVVSASPRPSTNPNKVDPLYLFACYTEWEQQQQPGAAWALIEAARSPHSDTRACARALLASSHHLDGTGGGFAKHYNDALRFKQT